MTDSSQFDHLNDLLTPISDEFPCGEDLDNKGNEEYVRIERDIEKAQDTREWKKLKKDIIKLLSSTKDIRLSAHFSRALLHTEKIPIDGMTQGLYLINEYITQYWDCLYPSEDIDEPDEKYADRINAIAELGSWKTIILPLRKKYPILSFDSLGEYTLEDLISFKKGDVVEGKQSLKGLIPTLTESDKEKINVPLNSFKTALKLAKEIKEKLIDKTEASFTDFDPYLLPYLGDGITVLSELSPNSEEIINTSDDNKKETVKNTSSSSNLGSIQTRDDVVILLDNICAYYAEHEPSSPLPLLLQRAKGIVHKDFLEVLEELVPDSISMTAPVFGRIEENEN